MGPKRFKWMNFTRQQVRNITWFSRYIASGLSKRGGYDVKLEVELECWLIDKLLLPWRGGGAGHGSRHEHMLRPSHGPLSL